MNTYQFGEVSITWLDGMRSYHDGGVLFGPVPKAVWNKKFPVNNKNQIPQVMDPILLQYQGENILIDTGIGTSKMTNKQRRNAGVTRDTTVEESLQALGLTAADIDTIIQTHMHNDHAGGLTKLVNETLKPVFSNATIYMNEIEWDEVRNPNERTTGTYLKDNWQPVLDQVVTFSDKLELNDAITLHHTGGHSRGHSIVVIAQNDETMIHMGDLLMTTAHLNPLWVPAVDDYPMTSIEQKKKWLEYGFSHQSQFIFYHDPYYALVQWDKSGEKIVKSIPRDKEPLIPYSEDYMI